MLGSGNQCFGNDMPRGLIQAGRKPEHLGWILPGRDPDCDHFGPALGKGARLVDDGRVNSGEPFKRSTVLDQDAMARGL
ncbi:hypothetical protein D3C71_1949670 [compost metagenome]